LYLFILHDAALLAGETERCGPGFQAGDVAGGAARGVAPFLPGEALAKPL